MTLLALMNSKCTGHTVVAGTSTVPLPPKEMLFYYCRIYYKKKFFIWVSFEFSLYDMMHFLML